MSEQTPEPTEATRTPDPTPTTGSGPQTATEPQGDVGSGNSDEPDTFPREYVEKLRRENAGYRERAQRADVLADRLMRETVRDATAGILVDPTDLAANDTMLDNDGLPDREKITAAARQLVERKPHLADRKPRGDIGQGATQHTESVNLAGMLRARA